MYVINLTKSQFPKHNKIQSFEHQNIAGYSHSVTSLITASHEII
jgi:hypothetical protein